MYILFKLTPVRKELSRHKTRQEARMELMSWLRSDLETGKFVIEEVV